MHDTMIHDMGLCVPSLPSLPSLPDALIRSLSAQNAFKRSKPFQGAPKRTETIPDTSKRSRNIPKHLQNVLQTLPNTKRSHTIQNGSKTLQVVPKLSLTFPILIHALCLLTYHTIPWHTMQYHTHHKNHTYGIGVATCIKSCMCSSLRQAHSHDAYVFHARNTSGFCTCHLRLENIDIRSLGHSCF